MKQDIIIVTHTYPDVDALCSVWLLKKFGGKRLENARVVFVPHGTTLDNQVVDSDDSIIHVDTGGGKFDHHDTSEHICAASLVYQSLSIEDEIVERIVIYVNAIDHFDDASWTEPLSDLYDFSLAEMLAGVRLKYGKEDETFVDWAMWCFDGAYQSMKDKYAAVESITDSGLDIEGSEGTILAIQTFNDEVIRVGLKMGYVLVMRRDPLKKYVRIKAHPRSKIDLTYLRDKLTALDPEATWILHADKKQLLNGSGNDASRVITELEFEDLVEVLRKL